MPVSSSPSPEKAARFRPALPPWIRVKAHCGSGRKELRSLIDGLQLNTVCESANCPNLGECWHKRSATFMILGNTCTRNCRFCAVNHGQAPLPFPDPEEPSRLAEAVLRMNLVYAVITSVTRDDLPDGGASHFVDTVKALKAKVPGIGVEVLTPDFNCDRNSLEKVIHSGIEVFNHNLETVERLSSSIRSKATYQNSLKVLRYASEISNNSVKIKSGIMAGMGESDDEILKSICDLYDAGVRILTIGQYLPPSRDHWKLDRYPSPEKFAEWKKFALEKGFEAAACAPLVRSSYSAAELIGKKAC